MHNLDDHTEAPLNTLAFTSLNTGIVAVFSLFLITGTCGFGFVLAPFGLVLTWFGLTNGVLGVRHARLHGFGGAYARYGILLNGLCNLLFTSICLGMAAALLQEMM